MDFNTLLEAALFSAIGCLQRGEIEFCKVKLEVMRILLSLISTSQNSLQQPPGPARALESFGIYSPEYLQRCSIARRLLREVMESDSGKMVVMRGLEVNCRALFVRELCTYGIVSIQLVVFFCNKGYGGFDLKLIQGKLKSLYAGILSLSERESLTGEVIELLYDAIKIDRTDVEDQEFQGKMQELLGAYEPWKALSQDCPILGVDPDRPQRLQRDLAYPPRDGLAPIDSLNRLNSTIALRKCVAILEFDLALRKFLDSHPELLVEEQSDDSGDDF